MSTPIRTTRLSLHHSPSLRAGALALFVGVALSAIGTGCAHTTTEANLSPLGRAHLREGFRARLEGSAIMLPLLECTSEGVDRIPNLDARAGSFTIADELWRRLGLQGEPEPDEAGRLAEHARLCKQLSDNSQSGNNVDTASPQMRELLRDYFRRHSAESWLVVSTRALQLGDPVPGTQTGAAVGVLDGRRYETDLLDANLYVFSRTGEVVFRADLACRGQNKGEEHDCGAKFEKAPARVAEMLEGFPLPIMERSAIIRVTPQLPSQRAQDAKLDEVPAVPIEIPVPPNEIVDESGAPVVKAGGPRGKARFARMRGPRGPKAGGKGKVGGKRHGKGKGKHKRGKRRR